MVVLVLGAGVESLVRSVESGMKVQSEDVHGVDVVPIGTSGHPRR
jgi:hypothetical protein